MSVETIVNALRASGCEPRRISPGIWVAACPTCRDRGRVALLEVRIGPTGAAITCAPMRDNDAEGCGER